MFTALAWEALSKRWERRLYWDNYSTISPLHPNLWIRVVTFPLHYRFLFVAPSILMSVALCLEMKKDALPSRTRMSFCFTHPEELNFWWTETHTKIRRNRKKKTRQVERRRKRERGGTSCRAGWIYSLALCWIEFWWRGKEKDSGPSILLHVLLRVLLRTFPLPPSLCKDRSEYMSVKGILLWLIVIQKAKCGI